MWQYQNTDELYHNEAWTYNYMGVDNSFYLQHYKYLKRIKLPNGKWRYIYNRPKNKNKNKNNGKIKIDANQGWNEGKYDNQKYTEIYNDKTKAGITIGKGSNKDNKYAFLSVGTPKDVKEYKEKSIRVGKYQLHMDNENGTFNVSVHKDHKKKKQ